jgi:hypothetical protein
MFDLFPLVSPLAFGGVVLHPRINRKTFSLVFLKYFAH